MTTRRYAAPLALFAVCAAVFLTALDQTVVVTALPQVITDLQLPPMLLDRAAWVVSGYLLGYVIVMPLMGRVSDLYGRRLILTICLGIFALGSLLCALAPQLGERLPLTFLQPLGIDTNYPGLVWLVMARFIQAIGGGAVVPVAMAVAADFYGVARRGIVLGLVGMVTEAGGMLGPLYGSFVVQQWNWPAIFYINLPLVALLLVLILLFVPSRQQSGYSLSAGRRIDWPGSLVLGAALLCMSLGLAQEATQFTATPELTGSTEAQNNYGLVVAALLLLGAFIALEHFLARRGRWPVLELALFRKAAFSAATLASFLIGAALIIAMVDIPIFFLTVYDQNSMQSGWALLHLTALIPVGALLGGWLCQRLTCRWTAILGLAFAALGFWLMHLWPLTIDWTLITVGALSSGLGLGLVIAPLSTTAVNVVGQQQLGMASSVVTISRMIGMILGLAALTSWGLAHFRKLVALFKAPASVPALSPTYNALYFRYITDAAHTVYTSIFLAAGILCVLACLPAFFLDGRRSRTLPGLHADDTLSNIHTDQPNVQESEASSSYGQRKK
ncbi:MFS transporter [Dictyobacter formicarum]|uniref:Triacylglyceride transporter n=1 Tax=Dictyobacter formicarum TaxID=2778368 RepID=A0ABQ3VR66_9CHLR|nr:MFS transporter [Dictyobacter formicarum]GHO88372.1 putative triacylglyceride transporter [Dictyobacter formicarum]